MATEIKKTELDEDFQLADGFDDELLDGIVSEMMQDDGSKPNAQESGKSGVVVLEADGDEPSASEFSLDELDKLTPDDPSLSGLPDLSDLPDFSDEEGPSQQPFPFAAPTPQETEEETEPPPPSRKVHKGKLVLMGAGAILALAIIAGGVYLALKPSPPEAPEPIHVNTMVKSPVSFTRYTKELDFFFLSKTKQDQNLVAMKLEFEFKDINPPDYMKTEPALLKDVVYSFLTSRQVAKNSFSAWQKVVEKELPGYIQAAIPENRIRSVRVTHMERI